MRWGQRPDLRLWVLVALAPLRVAMVWWLAVGRRRQPLCRWSAKAWFKPQCAQHTLASPGPNTANGLQGSTVPVGLLPAVALAGLACDPTLDAAMAHAWRRFGQWQRPLALVEISVDQLAQLRLQLGERSIQAVLAEVSRALKRALRAGDVLAQADDGVFRMLLPDTPAVPAQALMQRLLHAVGSDARLQPAAGQPLRLSAGLAHALTSDRNARTMGLRARAERLRAQALAGAPALVDAVATDVLPPAWVSAGAVPADPVVPTARTPGQQPAAAR